MIVSKTLLIFGSDDYKKISSLMSQMLTVRYFSAGIRYFTAVSIGITDPLLDSTHLYRTVCFRYSGNFDVCLSQLFFSYKMSENVAVK